MIRTCLVVTNIYALNVIKAIPYDPITISVSIIYLHTGMELIFKIIVSSQWK